MQTLGLLFAKKKIWNCITCTRWLTAVRALIALGYCDFIKFVSASLPSDTTCTVSRYWRYLRRLTVFFTATIYRGISWPWRYWYRHVGIDDKYRWYCTTLVVTMTRKAIDVKTAERHIENSKKVIKRWLLPIITLPKCQCATFYDFCCFRCVAISG